MSYRIVVAKQARSLFVMLDEQVERSYPIVLGRNAAADKAVEGDHATPLGEFYICAKNPRSKFFLSLCISYPNSEDAERGLAAGLITEEEYAQILSAVREIRMPPQHTRLGGEIYIHGHGGEGQHGATGIAQVKDWTRGCIALANADMQELYDRVTLGTAVSVIV
jgi:murein L,D-transpeptidase YafK